MFISQLFRNKILFEENETSFTCIIFCSGCPDQFQYPYECSCYYVESVQHTTRPDAQSYCEKVSSHLVFIETENEADFLAGIYNTSSQYWIGITGLPDDPKTWMDGTNASYNAFGSHNYTFDEKTGCYRLAPNVSYFEPNTWHDAPCDRDYGYICEFEGETFHIPIHATHFS